MTRLARAFGMAFFLLAIAPSAYLGPSFETHRCAMLLRMRSVVVAPI
ncbi:MAG TPA: hypothetical protein VG224_18555 [Reyranella sp.]|jgi:hypothetical protein|nr:hypothetical protein [Reyranella sp.]